MNYLTAEELDLCTQVRATCACNHLRRATRGITQVYEIAMAPSGLKVTQLPILVGLGSNGDTSVTTLAEAIGLDRTTLTRNLKVLEQRGLIRTVEHSEDARVRMVALTLEGSRVLSGALERWNEVQGAVEERFGVDRLCALYDELAALGDATTA